MNGDDLEQAGDVDFPRFDVTQTLLFETTSSARIQFILPRCSKETNIENSKYEYGRDEAISNTVGPIAEALPHGLDSFAFVHIQNELN